MLDAFWTSDSRSWRNWQTRTVQVRVGNHGGSNPFDRTTSQQTTLLSKTGFRPVFSCAPLLLLFPKKLTLFGDPDKKRWMSVCFIRKQEGFEPVRAWENTWVDKTEGLCQPLWIVETYANVLVSPNRHRSQNALHPCREFYLSLRWSRTHILQNLCKTRSHKRGCHLHNPVWFWWR